MITLLDKTLGNKIFFLDITLSLTVGTPCGPLDPNGENCPRLIDLPRTGLVRRDPKISHNCNKRLISSRLIYLSGTVMAATVLVALIFIEFSTSLVNYTDKNHRHKHNAYFSTSGKVQAYSVVLVNIYEFPCGWNCIAWFS